MIVRLGWASLVAASLILSPTSSTQGEDQRQPSDENAETMPAESEPDPSAGERPRPEAAGRGIAPSINRTAAVLETASEQPASPDAAPVDEEIESRAADDTDRARESEPPQAEPAAEIFVPSEDISEDFAVPFPVDI